MKEDKYEKLQELTGSEKRKEITGKIFRSIFRKEQPLSPNPKSLSQTIEPIETAKQDEERVSYDRPTINHLPPSEAKELFDSMGIEDESNAIHIIRYVGGINSEFEVEESLRFSEFRALYPLGNEEVASSLYVGPLSKEDFKKLKEILSSKEYLIDFSTENKFLDAHADVSPEVLEFLKTTVLPERLSFVEAQERALRDNKTPVTFFYDINMCKDLNTETKTLYWVDDIYVGEVSLEVGTSYNDSLAGVMAAGEIAVKLKDKRAGTLYWNTWYSNALRWIVDPYVRKDLLGESGERQISTML